MILTTQGLIFNFQAKFFLKVADCNIMNAKRVLNINRVALGLLLLAVVCLLEGAASGNDGTAIRILRPESDIPGNVQRDTGREVSPKYVKREGTVSFDVETFFPTAEISDKKIASPASFSGRDIAVSFFPDQVFQVTINSESRPKLGVLLLKGYAQGSELSTFSITITPENFFITFQELKSAMIYRVAGSTATGKGRVSEIDIQEMPPIDYRPPLIPPKGRSGD